MIQAQLKLKLTKAQEAKLEGSTSELRAGTYEQTVLQTGGVPEREGDASR